MYMPGFIVTDCDSDEADEIRDFSAQLAAGVSVNARDDCGDTRIMIAALCSWPYAAQILLEQHGADPNIGDDQGYRPLHFAEDVRIMQLLLEHGAQIDAVRNLSLIHI